MLKRLCSAILTLNAVLLVVAAPAYAQLPAPLTDQLLAHGPYGSAVSTLPLVDPTRSTPANGAFPGASTRTLVTEVWYPAADPSVDEGRDAAPASIAGGSPLVVYAHGLGADRFQFRFAARHLATHGYVVAAVDFPLSNRNAPGGPTAADVEGQAGDLFFVTAVLEGFSPFSPLIDPERTGLAAHSLGGLTSLLASSVPLFDGTFDAVVTMAGASCPLTVLGIPFEFRKPAMVMAGEFDILTPPANNALPIFAASQDPKYLVTVAAGTHGGFIENGPLLEAAFPGVPVDITICAGVPLDPIAIACGVCDPSPITGAPLAAQRQLDLTRAGVLAFFNGYLRCGSLDKAYLQYVYAQENGELDVTFSGHPSMGQAHCAVN